MEELFKNLDNKDFKVSFGLEAQGHIPTIQAELKRWNESYAEQFPDEPLDMIYSKHVWQDIGKIIGWCPFTAALDYLKWLHKNKD